VKGGEISRAVPVNTDGMRAIEALICWHREQYRTLPKSRPLFPSRNGNGRKRMTSRAAHNVLKRAFIAAGLNGHLATHSLRKSFAQRLYEQTGDVFSAQEMLGHKSIATTQEYLGVNYASVRMALQKMSLDSELLKIRVFRKFNQKYTRRNTVFRTRTPRVRSLQTPR
jgi:integrase/recombinase XerD